MLKQERKAAGARLRSLGTIAQIHYVILVLLSYLVGVYFYATLVANAAASTGSTGTLAVDTLLATGSSFASLFTIVLWTLVFAAPLGYLSTRPWFRRPFVLLPVTLLGMPLIITGIYVLLSLVTRQPSTETFVQLLVLYVVLSSLILVVITVTILPLAASIPEIIFLVSISARYNGSASVFPTLQTVLKKCGAAIAETLGCQPAADLAQILQFSTRRIEDINSRIQAVALATSAIGVLSILGLVLSLPQISSGLNAGLSLLLRLSSNQTSSSVGFANSGVLLAVALLLLFVWFVLWYFQKGFRNLVVNEIIRHLCIFCAPPEPHQQPNWVKFPPPPAAPILQPFLLAIVGLLLWLALAASRIQAQLSAQRKPKS